MKINWKGRALTDKMERCQRQGIDITMTQAVIFAKHNHPWQNRTGNLEGKHRITQKARVDGRGLVGKWGVADVNYGLFLETGRGRKWQWLRPTAMKIHPNLVGNIQRCMAIG